MGPGRTDLSAPERGGDDARVGEVVTARHEDVVLVLLSAARRRIRDGKRPAIHLHL